ncbi:GIY-YIG nuclease family protein [Rhizobium binxianense]
MKYVYILRSLELPDRYYIGVTGDLKAHLAKHNAKEVPHTSKYAPWSLKTYVAFSDDAQAFAFEKYLKTASGRAFAKKRL